MRRISDSRSPAPLSSSSPWNRAGGELGNQSPGKAKRGT